MKFKPTRQQQDVVDAFQTGKDVTISAGAGCGKSSTLEMVARSTDKTGLLIAFNRSVAEDAARKLHGTSTTALNTHRIAYAWARNDDIGKIVLEKMPLSNRVRRDQISRAFGARTFNFRDGDHTAQLMPMGVTDAAIRTLDAFMKDGSAEIGVEHVPYIRGLEGIAVEGKGDVHDALADIIVPMAQRMWQDICTPGKNNMRVTHDAYLKLWAAAKPELPYDFILLDEAQDTNPAVFSVFDSQQAQKISVGDACQQLFAWNGSVNIMEKFHAELHVKLTQSWRFGLAIQDAANIFLDKLNAEIRLEGNPRVESVIESDAAFDPYKSSSILVRTNAGAIQEVIASLDAGQSTHLIGGNKAFVALIEAAEKLQSGTKVTHPDFVAFNSWSEVREYANNDPDGMDLKVIVNLVENHGTKRLLSALDKCEEDEMAAQTVISTVHKVKGREWDQVRLASDFEKRRSNKQEKNTLSKEDLMLYYVAVTRAKTLLDPGPLVSFTGESGLAFVERKIERIATAIGDSLHLTLPPEVQADLKKRFDSKEDAESYLMNLLKTDLRSKPAPDAAM